MAIDSIGSGPRRGSAAPTQSQTPASEARRPAGPPAPAAQPERPEARFQRARNEDRFEDAAPRTGPALQPAAPRNTQVQVTDEQQVEVTQTTAREGGGTSTRGITSKGSEVTASLGVEQAGGGGVEGTVTASDEAIGVQGTLTNAAGQSYTGGVAVSPDGDSFTLSGATKEPNDAGGGEVTATVGQEGFSLGGERTDRGVTRQASVGITADGIEGSVGGSVRVPGGLSFNFKASGSHTSETQSEGGFTTTTTEGEVSLQVGGKLAAGGASVSGSHTETAQTSFQVRLPDADAARVEAGQAPEPNPYDPETLPEGGSILMRDREISTTTGAVAFRGAELGGGRSEEQGESLLVERTGPDTVRLTVGPEQALEDSFRAGYSIGPASVGASATHRLDASARQRAEFDLSTEEGRAAYTEALATRELPRENGSGVSNVETIQQAQVEFGAQLRASLGPLSAEANGNIAADRTTTTRPDGSQDRTTSLSSTTSVPITLQQSFRPDGTEDLAQQQLTVKLPDLESGTARGLLRAFSGTRQRTPGGPQDLELTLTPDHLRQLREQAQARIDFHGENFDPHHPPSNLTLQGIAQAQNLEQLAFVLHNGTGESTGLANLFQSINGTVGGQLPGTLTLAPGEE